MVKKEKSKQKIYEHFTINPSKRRIAVAVGDERFERRERELHV